MKTADFYNMLAPVYPAIDRVLATHKSVLIHHINQEPPCRLLEIGVGSGNHLSKYKGHRITGIDISPGMLKRARKQNGACIQLMVMDGGQLAFENESYEMVTLPHILAVASKPEQVLNEVYRVLVPGGKLFILNHFTPSNALQWLDKFFNPVSRLLHVRSRFYEQELLGLKRFKMISSLSCGRFDYFKLLILQKP